MNIWGVVFVIFNQTKSNQVIEKARRVIEGVTTDFLNSEEKSYLREFNGVVYIAYQKAEELLNNREIGGKENEREL